MRLLPWSYGVRNLGRAPVRTMLSVAGAALVVLLVLTAAACVRGLQLSMSLSADPDNVLLLGSGSEASIERSEIEPAAAAIAAASIDGLTERLGVPYVSPEIHLASRIGLAPGEDAAETDSLAMLRGVTDRAWLVHRPVRILEGRAPRSGEVLVGRLAATRMGVPPGRLAIGRTIWFDEIAWTVSGTFEAPGTVLEAEIWVPLSDLQVAARHDQISCVVVSLGQAEFADVDLFTKQRLDLGLVAIRETDYYAALDVFYEPVRRMIWLTSILMALGGLLGGLNTMYAAFAGRVREVGTLQTLGFGRTAIVLSLIQESLLTSTLGGLLAAGAGVFLLDGRAVRFSMGAFALVVDGQVLAAGLATAFGLGLLGALPPAWRALRLPLPESLQSS